MYNAMILATMPTVEGSKTERVLGLVRGNTVRARHIGNDLLAGLRNIIGGEVGQYSRLLSDAREEAIRRMVQQAEGLGANAVVNIRLATSTIMGGGAEILAYGTATVLEDQEDRP